MNYSFEEKVRSLEMENNRLARQLEIALQGLKIIAEHGDVGNISTKTLDEIKEYK